MSGQPDDTTSSGAALARDRARLTTMAYGMLGSWVQSKDAVQGSYARWNSLAPEDRKEVASPVDWLITVTGDICLDLLNCGR
jgi:DNA-directed RNA polymerase specialized sigma24 family protein